MSDSEQVTVRGLCSVNHRDLDNRFEDRTIYCPEKRGEFQRGNEILLAMRKITDRGCETGLDSTNSDIPGNVSSSCNNRAL